MSKGKAVVGVSGGVDSSVAVILMKEAGWDVTGVHMMIHPGKKQAAEDAARVAENLGIPFILIDLIDAFEERVSAYLSREYLSGRTPNPCVICNREIKFGLMIEEVEKQIGSIDAFATGHYAQSRKLENGRWTIEKGSDSNKDQAYFLSMLSQKQISKIQFPLFGLDKSKVREIAAAHGLFTSEKKESQDLCTGSYLDLIESGSGPGPFIEVSTGKEVGQHNGIENYTVGQRRGLNIGIGYPLYVIRIDRENNRVYVGSDEELHCSRMKITNMNWVGVKNPPLPWKGDVKIRYRDSGTPAQLVDLQEIEGMLCGEIQFDRPVRAITPGQLAVGYEGDRVAFGGFIECEISD